MGPSVKIVAAALPRGYSVNSLVREAGIGIGLGIVSSFIWHFTISKPVADKMANFYKK